MPSFCVVSNCEFKYVHSPNISFHKFPFHTEALLREWIRFTDRGEFWFPSRWSSICSRHFLPNDFRDHVSRKCLKRSAVPSVTIKSLDCSSIRLATHVPDSRNIAICRMCARKSIGTSSRSRSLEDPLIAAAIAKCFPTFRFDLDDVLPQKICSECTSQLNRFATYVDQIMSIQLEFQQRGGYGDYTPDVLDSYHTAHTDDQQVDMSDNLTQFSTQKMIKIKQEPLVNVKQEYVESSRATGKELMESQYIPDSDAFCECCDAFFINNIELKKHILTFHPGNNHDQVASSCEIMEIITLENAFINLAEEEYELNQHSHLDPHSDMIPLEQVLKVEHYNDYEQREQMRLLSIIQGEHCYFRRNSLTYGDSMDIESNTAIDTEAAKRKDGDFVSNICFKDDGAYETPAIQTSVDYESIINYQCADCLVQFPCQILLDKHIESHKKQSTTICEICSIDFGTTLKYLIHKQKSHPHSTGSVYQRNAKTIRCIDCSKRFSTKEALSKHKRLMCVVLSQRESDHSSIRNVYTDNGFESTQSKYDNTLKRSTAASREYTMVKGRYACSLCDRTYGRRSNFNRHFMLHRPRDQWSSKCPHCDTLFDLEHDVAVHIRSQKCAVQKLYTLPPSTNISAHETFSTLSSECLTSTQSADTVHTPLPCSNCSNNPNSRQDEPNNLPNEPINCDACGKHGVPTHNLRQHLKTNGKEDKFACSMCDKVFKRVAGLNQHVNGFHLKIKRHTCHICNYSYALKGDMKRCRHSRLS